jgi:hypothetical protein
MEFNIKNMKAGYQGKVDAMREMARKLMNHPGHTPDVILSKSAAQKDKMRPFKEGGTVKEEGRLSAGKGALTSNFHIEKIKKDANRAKEKEEDKIEYKKGGSVKKCTKREKFAEGGIGKFHHGQATLSGKQIPVKKKTGKSPY